MLIRVLLNLKSHDNMIRKVAELEKNGDHHCFVFISELQALCFVLDAKQYFGLFSLANPQIPRLSGIVGCR